MDKVITDEEQLAVILQKLPREKTQAYGYQPALDNKHSMGVNAG